jgi:hypothetical protein
MRKFNSVRERETHLFTITHPAQIKSFKGKLRVNGHVFVRAAVLDVILLCVETDKGVLPGARRARPEDRTTAGEFVLRHQNGFPGIVGRLG